MGLKRFIINLAPSPLVKLFASPYVAGDSIQAATDTARQFWEERKVCSTIDLLGEELESDDDVQYTVDVWCSAWMRPYILNACGVMQVSDWKDGCCKVAINHLYDPELVVQQIEHMLSQAAKEAGCD